MLTVEKVERNRFLGPDKAYYRARLGPLEARGDKITEARESVLAEAAEVLDGDYTPFVLAEDGVTVVAYRSPTADWSVVIDGHGERETFLGTREEAVRVARRALADMLRSASIERGDGPLAGWDVLEPDDEDGRARFIRDANFQLRAKALADSELSYSQIHELAGDAPWAPAWPNGVPEPERVTDPT